MKNILIVTNEYSSDSRPNERWPKVVSYFAQEWSRNNNVVVVINSSKFPRFYYYFNFLLKTVIAKIYHKNPNYITDRQWRKEFDYMDGNIRVYNKPLLKYFPHAKFTNKQLRLQILRIVEELSRNSFEPDIIVGHWIDPQLDIVLGLKGYFNAKTALVAHGASTRKMKFQRTLGKKLDQLDRFGCRNLPLAKVYYEKYRLREMPFVCPSGLPDRFINNIPTNKCVFSDKEIRFVTTCRLLNWKCIDDAVKGVSLAMGLDAYHYDIIGDGPEQNHINNIINKLGVNNKVSLLGRLQREEIQSKLQQADCFIMISKGETFGLVYLEAMIQGCITIGSKGGGIDGVIIDGINGFLCKEGDANDLARVLKHIMGLSREEINSISRKAIETAREYTDSKVAQRYLDTIC